MSDIIIPMKLGAEYDVNIRKEIIYVDHLVDVLNGTITNVNDEIIPESVTSIRPYLFNGDTSLTTVNLTHVTDVGAFAFANCAISYLSIPNLEIGEMQCFSYNPITDVVFPRLTYVSTGMFQNCTELASADFSSIANIQRLAFCDCTDFETLIIRTNYVVELENIMTFSGTKIESGEGYIYVPTELIESYQTASGWSVYATQFRSIDELV